MNGGRGEMLTDFDVPFRGQKWMVSFIFPSSIFLTQMSKLKSLLCIYNYKMNI